MSDQLPPSEREQQLERILADYLHAVEAGTAPDRASLLEQYPDLAGELRSFFRNRDAIERMAEPIKQQVPEMDTIGPEGAASAGGGQHHSLLRGLRAAGGNRPRRHGGRLESEARSV